MSNIFTKANAMMLRRAGSLWETDIDGECVPFYAIFDDEEGIETDSTGRPVVQRRASVLCETKTAKRFVFKQVIKDDEETSWQVHETLKESDGSLTRCVILEVTE